MWNRNHSYWSFKLLACDQFNNIYGKKLQNRLPFHIFNSMFKHSQDIRKELYQICVFLPNNTIYTVRGDFLLCSTYALTNSKKCEYLK